MVVRHGDVGNEFFIILRGSVNVIDESIPDRPRQLTVLGPGEAFGELALIEPGSLRRATIKCKEDCQFAVLHRSAYDR